MNGCAVAFLIVTSLGGQAAAEVVRGKVVEITDGDTLKVLDAAKVQHKIRLEGIDSPEKKQAYRAKRARRCHRAVGRQGPVTAVGIPGSAESGSNQIELGELNETIDCQRSKDSEGSVRSH